MVIRITDTENGYNVSTGQKGISVPVNKGELNKVIYGLLDSLETKGNKPLEPLKTR